ncbi:hypothetical protein [Streptomyces sp. NPDC014734]|uniref:hypothetical protein n=1 Tax=Streptomyces sp. NPDC014734 TaxID=3364886 RepID=UPI003701D496
MSIPDAAPGTTAATPSGTRPRFTEPLRELGIDVEIRRTRTRTRGPAGRGLFGRDVVRAVAGTPRTVFPLGPEPLIGRADGTTVDVRERSA